MVVNDMEKACSRFVLKAQESALAGMCVAREAAYFKRSFLVERDGDHRWVGA
jgi:hypothetical protein